MHIGLAAPDLTSSEAPTGIVTYVKVMKEALQAQGHRVSVLAGDAIETPGGDIVRNPLRLGPAGRLRRRIEALRPHGGEGEAVGWAVSRGILQAHARDPFDLFEIEEGYGFARHLVARARFPVVVRLHGPHFLGRDAVEPPAARRLSAVRIAAEGALIGAAPAVSCPSATLLAATLEHYRRRPRLAEVIPNPIAVEPGAPRWSAGRADPKQLLCVGRFDLRKGADVVLRAFALAAAADPTLRLVLAGPDAGLQQDDGRRIHFDAFVRAELPEAVRARVRFLGAVPGAEVRALRLASGIALVGSRFENFAYSVAEGMALGAPTIVSDSFGNAEMIVDGVTGRVVPVGDAPAMAAAILDMAGDPAGAAAMGAASRARCREWLSPARVAAATVDFYRRAGARG